MMRALAMRDSAMSRGFSPGGLNPSLRRDEDKYRGGNVNTKAHDEAGVILDYIGHT